MQQPQPAKCIQQDESYSYRYKQQQQLQLQHLTVAATTEGSYLMHLCVVFWPLYVVDSVLVFCQNISLIFCIFVAFQPTAMWCEVLHGNFAAKI